MCGFAGVIAWDEKYRVSRDTLARMSAAIAHRGPDGEGFHFSEEAPITRDRPQVAMAFRRLAILDPDPRSMQPFTDGRHWLVFNGEIYNFRELKKELAAFRPDYEWRTTGDTEVLLQGYAVWGEKCVEHLNGMFAFAVWDEVEKSLFLARDRMGQKPLYYTAGFADETAAPTQLRMDMWGAFSTVAFASEPVALRALAWNTEEIDPLSLAHYLRFGCTPGTISFSIGELAPGQTTSIGFDLVEERRYFDPNKTDTNASRRNSILETRQMVTRAVERQLVSDVPLGVFLSGGMDSSIVAACARRFGPVQTFCISFEDKRYDESEFAESVAKHLGTIHSTFRVTPKAIIDLAGVASVFGTPFGDSSALPTSYLAQQTRQRVKVALSGDGGDELFGGYFRYRAMEMRTTIPRFFFRIFNLMQRRGWGGAPKSRRAQIMRLLASLALSEPERYESYVRLTQEQDVRELLKDPLVHDNRPTTYPVATLHEFECRRGRDRVQAALAVDRITYLPDDLLTKVDRCSMLHGLEVRSPFMDHELVQFAAGLTTDQLLKGGPKRMLREAFKDDLPAWVFKRKKMGFAVPIGDWFRGPLRSMLRDTLFSSHAFGRTHFDMKVVERLVEEHETKRVDHSQRLYALLMLELWWNTARCD